MAARRNDLEVMYGTLDLLILKALSWGPRHGLGVLLWIHEVSGQRLQIEEGALYPALHRMEKRGWLSAEWGTSDKGRSAKFYRLTAAGRLDVRRANVLVLAATNAGRALEAAEERRKAEENRCACAIRDCSESVPELMTLARCGG